LLEIGVKAWTTTFADVILFWEASFSTSPPTVMDVGGYLIGVFIIVFSLEAWRGFPIQFHGCSFGVAMGAPSCVV
jgi:hypothetical protein